MLYPILKCSGHSNVIYEWPPSKTRYYKNIRPVHDFLDFPVQILFQVHGKGVPVQKVVANHVEVGPVPPCTTPLTSALSLLRLFLGCGSHLTHGLAQLNVNNILKVNASTRNILATICSEGYFKVHFLFGDYFQFGNYFLNK